MLDPAAAQDLTARLRAAGCVFAEDEARLLLAEGWAPDVLEAAVDRRVAGVPLEHILGWAAFAGLRIAVDPGVFVPRRRTEFLVEEAAALARPGSVVVDLCCGSGAVAAALMAAIDGLEAYAADIDPAAVACARRNLEAGGATVLEGDLDAPLPTQLEGRVDVLVANAPYVPSDEIRLLPPEARTYEPRPTLDGGSDGLDVVRRVAACSPRWLAPGGHLLVETSGRQAGEAVDVFARVGLDPRVARSDDLDATVVIGAMSEDPA